MAQFRVLISHRIPQFKKWSSCHTWCAHKPRILKLLILARPPFESHKRKTDTADQMTEVAKLSLYALGMATIQEYVAVGLKRAF